MSSKNARKINILEHELVPQHRVLTPQEAKEVLRELGCSNPSQLPWISIKDPVVKAIKAKPGDIVMIIRKSPTAGEFVTYRFVVVDLGVEKGGKGEEEEE